MDDYTKEDIAATEQAIDHEAWAMASANAQSWISYIKRSTGQAKRRGYLTGIASYGKYGLLD